MKSPLRFGAVDLTLSTWFHRFGSKTGCIRETRERGRTSNQIDVIRESYGGFEREHSRGNVNAKIVPLGTDWAAETYYGEPAKKLGLKYIGYKIMPQESSLYDDYGKDDPVIRDPDSLNDKGWEYTKKIYLQGQIVKLDLRRFRKSISSFL
ncbi:hypothetical protein F2Q69_00010445 [Brassica cretica]|uniref:Uncharacterized protein n=1 Tax=Brassica cretica TaxID=69181 RepID=A0A8S9R848_BRACR|nr:hypothetical protein F2Q69_00010445 [Brassica cretica]